MCYREKQISSIRMLLDMYYMLLRRSVEYIVIRFSFVTYLIKNILTKNFIKNLKVAKFSAANCKPSSEQCGQLV